MVEQITQGALLGGTPRCLVLGSGKEVFIGSTF
jgi:hypothetical protein